MKLKIPSRTGKSMEFKVSINELTSAELILKVNILIIIILYLSLLIIYKKFIHLSILPIESSINEIPLKIKFK
jgi:hypothetical protein